jgi:hypothetical protein
MTDSSLGQVASRSNGIDVGEITVVWQGKPYKLTRDIVLRAFDRSGYGYLSGPHARFFIEIDRDLKSAESVFQEIVPIPIEALNQQAALLIALVCRALGFEVLDSREHHLKS